MVNDCHRRLCHTYWTCGLALAFASFPVAVFAQDAPGTSAEKAEIPAPALDLLTVILLVFVAAVLVGLYIVYQRRMAALHEREALSAAAFEAEVISSVRSPSSSDGPPSARFIDQSPTKQLLLRRRLSDPEDEDGSSFSDAPSHASSAVPAPGYGSQETADRVDAKCAWAIDALRQAGILDEVDSLETRHGHPKSAAILKLKRGRNAILLQEMESLLGTCHLLARFDMVIVANPHGKAVIIKTMNQVIADQF
jgi:hypothetical protein